MEIIDYRVITAVSGDELQGKIQTLIQQGWQPLGGVQIQQAARFPGMANRDPTYVQTLVRYSG